MPETELLNCVGPFAYLAALLLATRSGGYDKHLDRPPGQAGSHQPGNLNRNRAAILLHNVNENTWIGDDWIGVSGNAELHLPKGCGLKVLKPEADGCVDVGKILGLSESVRLEHTFGMNGGHGLCSEVALFNGLDHYLLATGAAHLGCDRMHPCNLYLLTERLPCSSCTYLLNSFLKKFSSTMLHAGFMFEITSGSQEVDVYDFLSRMKDRTAAYKIQIVSGKDSGYLPTEESGQWSPWVLGTLPQNDTLSANRVFHDLHIVPIRPDPSTRCVPSVSIPDRNPGQPSAHLSARICPDVDFQP
jgi:hypothetical protein